MNAARTEAAGSAASPEPPAGPPGLLRRMGDGAPRAGATLGAVAIFLIMVVTVADVTARSLFSRSVAGMIESAEIILVVAAFLGLGYAQRMKAHVSTGIVMDALSPRASGPLRRIGLAVATAYAAFATVVSALRAWDSFRGGEVRFGLIEIPQWPARLAIAIGFALLLVELARALFSPHSPPPHGEPEGPVHGH